MRLVVAAAQPPGRIEREQAVIGGDRTPPFVEDQLDAAEQQHVARPEHGGDAGGGPRGSIDRKSGVAASGQSISRGLGAGPAGQAGEAAEILRLEARVPFVLLADIGLDDADRGPVLRRRPARVAQAAAPSATIAADQGASAMQRPPRLARGEIERHRPAGRRRRTGHRCRSSAPCPAKPLPSRATPTGFQAKPVNRVARSHSVTIHAAARTSTRPAAGHGPSARPAPPPRPDRWRDRATAGPPRPSRARPASPPER